MNALARWLGPGLAALSLFLAAGAASAQNAELSRVEALLDAGEYAEARTLITRWWEQAENHEVAPADRVRALILRARLEPDPHRAERDYLAVVLGHPLAPEAPYALLNLGQALLAMGAIQRAEAYLQRLVTDYPDSPQRPVGLLWLARARRMAGRTAAACAAVRDGIAATSNGSELAALLRAEEADVCASTTAPEPREAEPAPERREAAPAPSDARFSVQVGAFRNPRGAQDLAARLRSAGFEPRIITVEGNTLLRVRVGYFPDGNAARAHARRLREAGFETAVVNDVAREREHRPGG